MNSDQLPKGWVWTRLGDIRSDKSRAIVPHSTPEQMFELYSVPAFESNKPEIVLGKAIGSNKQIVEEEAVLLCKINPRINRVWIVGNQSSYLKIASTEWIPFFKQDGIDPKYLCYFMYNSNFRAFLSLNVSGVGGSLMRIKADTLSCYPFPLPPLPEQRRIVTKIEELFTKLDAGVEALKKTQAQLKRYRQSVLKAACEGKLVPTEAELAKAEGRAYEPADMLLARINDIRKKNTKGKYIEMPTLDISDLPVLPEGWLWVQAQEVCNWITNGYTPKANKMFQGKGEIPFIKVYNLTNKGELDFSINPTFISKETHTKELSRSNVFPGDILMNIVGPPLGKVSIVSDIYPEWNINQAIVIYRPLEGYDRKFLCYSLLTDNILSWAIKRSKATAGQFNLTITICRYLPLPLPPLAEQRRIVAEVERRLSVADEVARTVEQSLAQDARLRQSILKKAFEGKLVPQNPEDEPASVLLERIKAERAHIGGRRGNDKNVV